MSLTQFDPVAPSVPRLLVELPSRTKVFHANLRDLIFQPEIPPVELHSAPAAFWHDVFVERGLPWYSFLQSLGCHVAGFALLIAFLRLFDMQPHVIATPVFDEAEVAYYQPSEYLPPLDTRDNRPAPESHSDPEFSRQAVISVPREADNRSQTLVTAPSVRLKRDVALPNIVAWSDRMEKPTLAIPAAPLTLAADLTRSAPELENSVVSPPPDAARLAERRRQSTLHASVVAPPPELHTSRVSPVIDAPQPAVVAPPPSVERTSDLRFGHLDVDRSTVINPAPQLAVVQQRTALSGRSPRLGGSQVVPPPPSVSASGSPGQGFGSRGRMIALNLHPSVGAPSDPPAGNRRGSFAATPEGRSGASGSPGSLTGSSGAGERRTGAKDLPGGLYVGRVTAKSSPIAGDPASKTSTNLVNPNLLAGLRSPRLNSTAPSMQPTDYANLTEAERQVFAGRKFYSLTLNMPNLNSAGGSWIIRFAELQKDDSSTSQNSPAADLSQPVVTRKVDPAYPLQLMRQNVAGTVIIYAVIHADGTAGSVRVLRGVDARLDRFAREAVAQWQFEPAMKDGHPVDVEATFHVPFRPGQPNF